MYHGGGRSLKLLSVFSKVRLGSGFFFGIKGVQVLDEIEGITSPKKGVQKCENATHIGCSGKWMLEKGLFRKRINFFKNES